MNTVHVRSWSLAALLAALSMLGPFSIDMYLPAFHDIAGDFGVSQLAVQQTLSSFLFAYAFMSLWHGAVSDAVGRKPVVVVGLGIYAFATLGCAIAGNIQTLWLFRTLQGVTAGAGFVVGRAIIRDRFHGPEAQRLMSQVTLVFGVAPALAPVIGGILLNTLGWRAMFWMLLVLVILLLAWSARRLPETLAISDRQSMHPIRLWRNYTRVLRDVDFVLLATVPALNFAAFFLYIASAPSFLIDLLGVSSYGFAWLFIPMISGVIIGASISGRMAGRLSAERTVGIGYVLMFLGAALELTAAWFAPPFVVWHVMPIMAFTMGSGVASPTIVLLMLDLFPKMRGLVSSLQGCFHFALAAVNAGTISPFLAYSLKTLSLGMTSFTIASLALWTVYRRRAGRRASKRPGIA